MVDFNGLPLPLTRSLTLASLAVAAAPPRLTRTTPPSIRWVAGYLDTLRSVPSRWKVLVVDQYTQAMLHSVLSTYEVLEEGVQRASPSSLCSSQWEMGTELEPALYCTQRST